MYGYVMKNKEPSIETVIDTNMAVETDCSFGLNLDREASAQALAGYCCDMSSFRRCVLAYPATPGSSCFCYGQGYGYACY